VSSQSCPREKKRKKKQGRLGFVIFSQMGDFENTIFLNSEF
jgi:hypothetical protein